MGIGKIPGQLHLELERLGCFDLGCFVYIILLANGNNNLGVLGEHSKGCLRCEKQISIPNSQPKVQKILV